MPILVLLFAPLLSAATLSVSPETIFDCVNGLGRAALKWSEGGGAVDLRVGSPTGPSLTGLTGPEGESITGDWVTDGMRFFLVSEQGSILASLTARVRCGGTLSTVDPGLKTGSYFPLQTGNSWIYRQSTRTVTSSYLIRTITHTEELGGKTYYAVSGGGSVALRLRGDADGRLWRFTGTASSPSEELLLPSAATRITPYQGPLGSFDDAVTVTGGDPLLRTEDVYVRGIGPVRSESRLLTGSSGGFTSGLELVEARLDGGLRLLLPMPRLSISVERTSLDVTGRNVTNCAVPSYCVACFGDPRYRPCARARLEAGASATYTVDLELVDAGGQVAFRAPAIGPQTSDLLAYVQLQLYSQPDVPLAPGLYTLHGRLRSGADLLAASSIQLRIE